MATPREPMEMPQVELAGLPLMIVDDEKGNKVVVIGPVLLTLPLDAANAEWMVAALKGVRVQVAPAAALKALPPLKP